MNGIELAARFSYITSSLQFCGPKEASQQFLDYFKNKNNEEEVKKSLIKFESLYPYLFSIAEKNGKDIFDFDVVEAYWIGNSLLDNFENNDMKNIIKKLIQRGLPRSFGEKLIENLPSGFMPHHNFNVFYVGVGMLTKTVATNIQNMDNCRISFGKVIEVLAPNKLIISSNILKKQNKKMILEDATKTAVFLPELLQDVKEGDNVALHWGFASLVLNNEQLEDLKNYSNRIVTLLNKNK